MFVCFFLLYCFFFFKQKTAYEMRISDWSSDVCSSDLFHARGRILAVDEIPDRPDLVPDRAGEHALALDLVEPHQVAGGMQRAAVGAGHAERQAEQPAEIGRAHV